jgi:hypothetical protein
MFFDCARGPLAAKFSVGKRGSGITFRAMLRAFSLFLAFTSAATAAITFTGVADKTKYIDSVTFTVVADSTANTTTTAKLDGVAIPVGVAKTLSQRSERSYHEITAESRNTTTNAVVDSKLVRFVIRDTERMVGGDPGTEDGIPPFTPLRTVYDAPSAFAGQTLKIIAPAAWPADLPVPLAAKLVGPTNETVRLNGLVTLGGFPGTSILMRRGWGSVVAPAKTTAGAVAVAGFVSGLSATPTIQIEAAPVFTDVSGTIAANTTWPANSRIYVSGALTVNAGVTLTIGAGTIVKVYTGNGASGSASEITVNGALVVNGTEAAPVAFVPATPGGYWGGIELPTAASSLTANWTIFHGAGEEQNWFDTHTGYSTHKKQQALFLVSGAGSGTSVGAKLHLADCFCFSLAGQVMNSKVRTFLEISRTLMMRAVTCGEQNDCRVTIDRSALLEFPSETAEFVDADNDAIYLTSGDLSVTNTVIGFTKDDGIDSGGNGGASPFGTVDTATNTTTTRFVSTNNWYEGAVHEGNSLSGTRNVYFTGCVFLNNGQGVECGYSNGSSGDGPNALVDGCLFVNNMVGVRWGDNYGNGYVYNGSMEVKNSLVLNSGFRDAFSGEFNTGTATGREWIYQTTNTNTFGHPYFNVHDNYLSQPDAVHHPVNTTWDPNNAAHTALLHAFMPVPGANVGVAISTYQAAQSDPSTYAATFTARLSSFRSKPVSVGWTVFAKADPLADAETTIATGTLDFHPGDTVQDFTASIAAPSAYRLIRVALHDPVNAEVTGDYVYLKTATVSGAFIARASSGWRYREARSEPPAAWKTLGFDDSSAAATEWLPATLPAGFGATGLNTTVNGGSSTDRTKAFYFRKKFTVADPAQFSSLTLTIKRDDAAVVWLNNDASATVVSGDGTFTGPYTYAMTGVPNATSTGYLSYPIPVAKLVAGENILAIELHQTSLTSGDILLDGDLIGTPSTNGPLKLNIGKSGGLPLMWWNTPTDVLERSTDLQNWFPAPVSGSPVTLTPNGAQEFYRLRR